MALVLILLCVEALLGSLSTARRANSLSPALRGEGWREGRDALNPQGARLVD
jgi:hypothetical protein